MNSGSVSMSQLTVSGRLSLAFGGVIGIFFAVACTILYANSELSDADNWNRHTYEVLGTADKMLQSMINMETGARGFLLAGDEKFLEPWNAGTHNFDASWSEAKHLTADNPSQQKRLDEIKAKNVEFVEVETANFKLRRAVTAGTESVTTLTAEFVKAKDKSAMDGFRSLQADFDKAERDLLAIRSARAEKMRAWSFNAILFGGVLAVAFAIAMGLWVTRALSRQLGGEPAYAASVVSEIAKGNLAVDVQLASGDTTSLLAAMKTMRDSLAQVVGNVRSAVDSMRTASGQIAEGNQDLSSRTEQQASSLQETAASMEQLTSAIRQSTDSAKQANTLAGAASVAATKGGEVVTQVISTMGQISASSSKIAEIISVIDGIAFQTNILALNAAVEAARAGEQGRGFAVVATEVRNLAQRSAQAAREIKDLIGDSVEKVGAGSKLVDAAGTSMSEIVDQIRRVTTLIGDVTNGATEQAAGIEQVNEAVTQMDTVTQQNAALVEESAAAAASLKEQALRLAGVVAVFKLHQEMGDWDRSLGTTGR